LDLDADRLGDASAARMVARPQALGSSRLDISDEMVRQARAASKEFENVMFVVVRRRRFRGRELFDKVLSWNRFITIGSGSGWLSCFG